MKVRLSGAEREADIVIAIGDVFVGDTSNPNVYILTYDDVPSRTVKLRRIDTEGCWKTYPSIENAQHILRGTLKEGRLKHYPASKYVMDIQLTLK